MEYIFAFAGIPAEIFPDIQKQFSTIARGRCTFISKPLSNGSYSQSESDYYIKTIASHIENDHENKLANSKFSIIYIDYNDSETLDFSKSFFPFLLPAGVSWQINLGSKTKLNESKNELIKLLTEKVNQLKDSLNAIKKEITEKSNKTPLLLPLKNFESDVLLESIQKLSSSIVDTPNKENTIKEILGEIKSNHPPQRLGKKKYECFVDKKNVEFHAPGKSLHGKSRPNSGHPLRCLLSGNIRLGAKFSHGFHYDCIKGSSNLEGMFWGCHEDKKHKRGGPHLNISPNDHVR